MVNQLKIYQIQSLFYFREKKHFKTRLNQYHRTLAGITAHIRLSHLIIIKRLINKADCQ